MTEGKWLSVVKLAESVKSDTVRITRMAPTEWSSVRVAYVKFIKEVDLVTEVYEREKKLNV